MKNLHLILGLMLAAAPIAACGDDDDGDDVPTGNAGSSAGSGQAGSSAGSGGMASGDGGVSQGPADIVDTAVAADDFTQLAQALTTAGLVEALKGDGPFTVFAPNDAAFEAFEEENPGVLADLSQDELANILQYHVVSGAAVRSSALQDGQLVETLAGPVLAIDLSGGSPLVNDARVVAADVEASNGVIHVIDRIIIPPGDIVEVATSADQFTILAQALADAELIETLQGEGPFTVFAPTDAAFEALASVPTGDALADVLTYHVLPGIAGPLDLVDGGVAVTVNGAPVLFELDGGAKINDANITVTNVVASNGVIHVIDAVIVPPENDIVQTAVAAGTFTSLVAALGDAGLVETLQGEGPFTVFAPTDDAFAELAAVPTGDALENVLLGHVISGAVGSGNLTAGDVEMLSGNSVMVATQGGVTVGGASVTMANILASNGVIHVIDAVLVPD
jgi:transforming growth factor-beta-induced protein